MGMESFGFSTNSIVNSKKNEILNESKSLNPGEAAASYSKRMAEFQEKLAQKIKDGNNNMLTNMLANVNPNCNDFWSTKYTKSDIESLQYYLGCCNGQCDSSIQSKIDSLKAQQPILQKKLIEFQNGQKDTYTLQMGDKAQKIGGLDIPV